MFHLSYISILKSLGNISSLKYLCHLPFLMYFCIKRKFYVLENPSVGKCYLKIWYDVMYLKLLSLYLCNCTEMHSDWKTTFAVCHFQITKQEEVEPKMTV